MARPQKPQIRRKSLHIGGTTCFEAAFFRTSNFKVLPQEKYPKDVEIRVWSSKIEDELKARHQAALKELEMLVEELQRYPINYNHYCTDTIANLRKERQKEAIEKRQL
jgi:hypothetical protein